MKTAPVGRALRGAASRSPACAGACALLWALLCLSGTGSAGEEPGWYRVELSAGEPITARLVSEEPGFYTFTFQGSVLRVAKGSVRKLERLASEKDRPLASSAPSRPAEEGKTPAAQASDSGKPARPTARPAEDAKASRDRVLREAVESLSSENEEEVRKGYASLAADFPAARALIHTAAGHGNRRVRVLAVKLLGELGTVKDDLPIVTARLSDDASQVRLAAVLAIRSLGPAGLPALIDRLHEEPDPANRKCGVMTLKLWNDRRAVVPLVDLLGNDEDGSVKNFIALALASLTGKSFGKDVAAWSAYLSDEKLHRRLGVANEAGEAPPKPAASKKGAK